jgi:hypothetical protein
VLPIDMDLRPWQFACHTPYEVHLTSECLVAEKAAKPLGAVALPPTNAKLAVNERVSLSI